MFNNVLDRKEIFFVNKNFNLFQFQKSHFSKGVNACFWSKNVSILIFQLKPWIDPFGKITSMRLCKMDIFIVWKDFLSI